MIAANPTEDLDEDWGAAATDACSAPKGRAKRANRSGAFDERPELVPVAALLGLVNALLHLGDLVV